MNKETAQRCCLEGAMGRRAAGLAGPTKKIKGSFGDTNITIANSPQALR